MRAALREGVALLVGSAPTRRRTLLAAVGVVLAATMLGTAVTVSWSLATGFERAADEADLPDVIARFDRERRGTVDERLRALPNVEARGYRTEVNDAFLEANGHETRRGALHFVREGRRGYAVVEGRDVRPGSTDEAVVERGLADAWDLKVGQELGFGRFGGARVVGVAVGPDNVAFPLASAARVYMSGTAYRGIPVNVAMLWVADRTKVDVTLQQARATSYGITDLRFITRDGVRVLLDRAAGVVLALLGAFALVVLVAAGVMLGVSAHADVQRRLGTIGVQRALGFPRGTIVAAHAARAALIALPAGAIGLALGALVAAGPTGDLLATLNELPPGSALLGPLAVALAGVVVLVSAASAWPAYRATGASPVALLRGGELAVAPRPRGRRRTSAASPLALGIRLAVTRRARYLGTVAVLATCVGVVALLLALASLLVALRDDPSVLGKRYQLTVRLGDDDLAAARQVAAVPGVAAAAPRIQVEGADSYALGEPVRLVSYPGDHTRFEAPALADGRRARAEDEAEIGLGLADALNLRIGGTLAVQLPSGGEARYRVVGTVRALDEDGRIAYVGTERLAAADPTLGARIAVRLDPGASRAEVGRRLRGIGAEPFTVGGVTTSNAGLLATLAALLRAVAGVTALVCLYALVQGLALVALERRPTIALLRSMGGTGRTVGLLLAGVVLAAAVPAALLGLALARWVLGPAVGALAAGYADLAPEPTLGQALLVLGGLTLLCAVAAALVAHRTNRSSIVSGLRS